MSAALGGKLLRGVSTDWQIAPPDSTALAGIRSTQTDAGVLLCETYLVG
jgi:hypothetical protein